MRTVILGISAFYHDSAAAIVVDGEIIAAAQEERFTRIRHDPAFPVHAVAYVMDEAGVTDDDLTAIVFYDKPFLKFERLLETFHAFAPRGLKTFLTAIPVWIKGKLFMRQLIRDSLPGLKKKIPVLFGEHHLSHAASAFYPGPFEEAAILTIDGVGEWATATISRGTPAGITILKELHFPHSPGLLYAAFTYYLGFRVNSGEYKLMGLAPYGDRRALQTEMFKEKILSELVDVKSDGSILLNLKYFDFVHDQVMIREHLWQSLFGIARRVPESDITQEHMNLAAAIQEVTESIVLKLVETTRLLCGTQNLVMAGGVALNCVSNSRVVESGIFRKVWIQPAAGDAGGALGAALACAHLVYGQRRKHVEGQDGMKHACLGPAYGARDVLRVVNRFHAPHRCFAEFSELSRWVSGQLAAGKIIGWFQGRMEFGPRALGNRSILADPRSTQMQKQLNVKIKAREEFRPFAPCVLEEDAARYFTDGGPSPYMLFVRSFKDEFRVDEPADYASWALYKRLYHIRSNVPAVTHIDYSARVQTVSSDGNPNLWQLLTDFKRLSGIGMLINTSFNVRGEPIVCTPDDAYRDFMRTEMDLLVIGNYVFDKQEQSLSQALLLQMKGSTRVSSKIL